MNDHFGTFVFYLIKYGSTKMSKMSNMSKISIMSKMSKMSKWAFYIAIFELMTSYEKYTNREIDFLRFKEYLHLRYYEFSILKRHLF